MKNTNLLLTLKDILSNEHPNKIIISKPVLKSSDIKKIVAEPKAKNYQFSKYTEKQVFHENISAQHVAEKVNELTLSGFRQINLFSDRSEHIFLISKDGSFTHKQKATGKAITIPNGNFQNSSCPVSATEIKPNSEHNRKKNYILNQGLPIAPLVDMGIFTSEGKIVHSMYDKYRQINRFLEILDDEVKNLNKKSLNV